MMYLDPRSDMVFKRLFGSSAHKNIVISFLNSVLGRLEGELIVDVVINDPNNVPETRLSKTSIVDVRCTDQQNNHYIIEMQVVAQKDYAARAQYYSSLVQVPQELKEPLFEEAFDILAQSNWSKTELEAYDRYLDAIRSHVSQIETAEERGEARGEVRGEAKAKLKVAKALLDVLDVDTIAQKTGLSIDQVEELKSSIQE